MIYQNFGKTDMKVSVVGMGCEYVWHADEETTTQVLERAIAAGVNYFNLTPVQCLSYVHSFPQVDICPVPGVKDVAELEAALAYVTATEAEKDFSEINDSLAARFESQCMYCNHCQPCPKGIDIAEVTKLADMAEQGMTDDIRTRYDALEVRAADCIQCESCTGRCPFGIDAAGNMRRALNLFGN